MCYAHWVSLIAVCGADVLVVTIEPAVLLSWRSDAAVVAWTS